MSGTQIDGDDKSQVFVRSTDHGATWTFVDFPPSDDPKTHAFIGAVDPIDPDRVYVRLSNAVGGLLVTSDAGETWNAVDIDIETSVLRGLAVSPDGQRIAVGGEYDGVWLAPTDDLIFEKVSDVAIRCLTWTEQGLHACVNERLYGDGYIVGTSTDAGASFTPQLSLACVRGVLTCDADTTVGAVCPSTWKGLADKLDVASCAEDESTPGSGGAGPIVTAPKPTRGPSCALSPLGLLLLLWTSRRATSSPADRLAPS